MSLFSVYEIILSPLSIESQSVKSLERAHLVLELASTINQQEDSWRRWSRNREISVAMRSFVSCQRSRRLFLKGSAWRVAWVTFAFSFPSSPFPHFVSIEDRLLDSSWNRICVSRSLGRSGTLSFSRGSSCRQFFDNWIETHSHLLISVFSCLRLTKEVASLLSKVQCHNRRLLWLLNGQQCGYFNFTLVVHCNQFYGWSIVQHCTSIYSPLAGNGEQKTRRV